MESITQATISDRFKGNANAHTNGEVSLDRSGIAFFQADIRPLEERTEMLDRNYPQKALEIYEHLQTGLSLYVEGKKGSGKTTTMSFLRAIFREVGINYVTIDGHYPRISSETIGKALEIARQISAVVIYDGADRIIITRRRVRIIPIINHLQRSTDIITALENFIAEGGQLVLTTHNQEWRDARIDTSDELWQQQLPQWNKVLLLWSELATKLDFYRLDVAFDLKYQTVEELASYYKQHGIPEPEATYLSRLPQNSLFLNYLERHPETLTQLTTAPFYSRRFAKLTGNDPLGRNKRLLHLLEQNFRGVRLCHVPIWKEFLNLSALSAEP